METRGFMRYFLSDATTHIDQVAGTSAYLALLDKLRCRSALVGVIGLGYVGLPLSKAIAETGFYVIGFDKDRAKILALKSGHSYVPAISDREVADIRPRFEPSDTVESLSSCDVVIICVPTPLAKDRTPDQSSVVEATKLISAHLREAQLIIAESTNYPGSTRALLKPILEASGLAAGHDFFLAYSPEREDPGNSTYRTNNIPKIVSGIDEYSLRLVSEFYSSVMNSVVTVSSPETAEASKLLENTFRAVNISLINELKQFFDGINIDIWEVIEAAKTKPFGFMPFYPGPGIGGHCIPVDPVYLTWHARNVHRPLYIVEAADMINRAMPQIVVDKAMAAVSSRGTETDRRPRALVLGVAYKPNIPDVRESSALAIIELLKSRCDVVAYHDPLVPELVTDGYTMRSVSLDIHSAAHFDVVIICTDHDDVNLQELAQTDAIVVDTRNAISRRNLRCKHLVKA
ncbi:nucleotide sugar dehydrogenase [Sinorhizobium meliloti]|uniref:nucleotide sugar dehydrogenase n=1 Tax=Rhizobium meliloti TaxID=382 RepID=UPI002073D281|nr:nucleotide sugar dehydrogenase [Sinorhizobium meliloti]MCM5693034.1 nucleotide sugar dehydrogenase [Sinorhizobium meliloti]